MKEIMMAATDTEVRARVHSSDKEMADVEVRIDLERTRKALVSKAIKAPSGMSKNEMRQFILSHAD